ncbi:MAG: FMN-binding protein [Chloroflexi bacterium]|nr:FMN-binding protein [Chloroflexota bacterium]
MARKMPRRLVALSTSAIATIYFAGFVATRSADAGMAGASAASVAPTISSTTATATSSTSLATPVVGASAQPTATSTSSAASTTVAYKDGTYTGSGTSRRGGVNVSVTVQNGQTSNVQITSVSTEYPVSRIASLPAQVIAKQSAQVNTISGATYSTQAFVQAVQQALSKAS